MKIPVKEALGWVGRALLSALVDAAAERLSRRRASAEPVDQRGKEAQEDEGGGDRRLDAEQAS